MQTLCWLHLSDWHQRGPDFDRGVVRDGLLDDIKRRAEIDPRLARVDFIIFSGDAAFGGLASEFESARQHLFDPVLSATCLDAGRLFFVPGNHDINRHVVSEMLPAELQKPFVSDDLVKKWLTDEKKRTRALEPFDEYTRFVSAYTGQCSPDYASTQRLSVNGLDVALLGLNSAWMCGRNKDVGGEVNDYGFLNVGEPQVHDALAAIKDANVRLAVVHHPFSWLQGSEQSAIEDRLRHACHFILRGHEHKPNFDLGSGVHGQCAVIPAGASYDRRKASDPRYTNAYNLVHLDVQRGSGTIFCRRWSDGRTRWIADVETCEPAGKHEFELPKALGLRRLADPVVHVAIPNNIPNVAALEQEHRSQVVNSFKDLSFRGLTNSVRPILLPLEKVYVQLRAVAEVPESADEFTPEERRVLRALDGAGSEGLIDASELREAHMRLDALRRERWTRDRLERFPISKALNDAGRRGLVILGDPGSGKSTLLNFLALVFARGPQAVREHLGIEGDEANRLPILAPLAAYDDMLNHDPSLTIRDFVARFHERQNMPGLGPLFEAAMDAGRALVLLDGMDEVLDEGRRKFVAEQASTFIRALIQQGNRVLLTSRIYGYRSAPLSVDLPHVTVLDFRREEIEVFARQWNRAIAEWEYADRSPAERLLLAGEAERQLLEEIGSNPGVQKLAVNPLLLSMLALLRRQVGRLPQQRIRLYHSYLNALIEAWESIRSRGARVNAPTRPDAAKTDLVLIPLALWLQNHKPSGTATEAELLRQISAVYLREAGLPADTAPTEKGWQEAHGRARKFLEDMRRFSGILVERGHGAFGFRHLTFQEYYVGRAIARMAGVDRWALLRSNLHANRWREPILLAAAQLGNMQSEEEAVTKLIASILAAGSPHESTLHRDLLLAADCAVDDINVRIDTLREIVRRLAPLALSPVPTLAEAATRRLVGLALLTAGDRPRLPEAAAVLCDAVSAAPSRGLSRQSFVALTACLLASFPALGGTLVETLDDPDESVRSDTIRALAPLLPDQHAFREAVARKLDDPSQAVQTSAIVALAPLVTEHPSWGDAIVSKTTALIENRSFTVIWGLSGVVANQPVLSAGFSRLLEAPTPIVRLAAIEALRPVLNKDPSFLQAIVRKLEDRSEQVRRSAVGALSSFVTQQPVCEALVPMLEDPDAYVRATVIAALAPLLAERPSLFQAISSKIDDASDSVRNSAIRALAPLLADHPALTLSVFRKLDDPDDNLRVTVMRAITPLLVEQPSLREAVARKLEDSNHWVRSVAMRALLRFDDHRPYVQTLFAHSDWRTRRDAVGALAEDVEAARVNIASVLSNLNAEEAGPARGAAVDALACLLIDQPSLRAELIERLADPSKEVRLAAINSLTSLLPEPSLRDAIVRRISDGNEDVRLAAVRALAPLWPEDPTLREALVTTLDDSSSLVRHGAVEALTPTLAGEPSLREAVTRRLDDPVPHVRMAAVEALAPLWADQASLREMLLDDPRAEVRRALIAAVGSVLADQPGLTKAIERKLDDPDGYVRAAALGALVPLMAAPAWLHAASALLNDPEDDLRIAGLTALAPVLAGHPPLHATVAAKLGDSNQYVRAAAIQALAPLLGNQPSLHEAILDRFGDESDFTRDSATRALAPVAKVHPVLCAAVVERLVDPNADIRRAAIETLAPFLAELVAGSEPAGPNCRDSSPPDPAPGACAATMSRNGPTLLAAIVAKIDDASGKVQASAIAALAPLLVSDPALCERVVEQLDAPAEEARGAAIQALSSVWAEHPLRRKRVAARLKDPSDYVRAAAIAALVPHVSDPDIRAELAPALRGSASSYLKWTIRTGRDLRELIVESWGRWIVEEPAAAPEVEQMLASPDSGLRKSGAEILRAAGKDAVSDALPQLLAAVDDQRGLESWPARIAAAELLINDRHFSRAAVDTLVPALSYCIHPLEALDDAPEIRRSAALALARLKADEYRPEVAKHLEALLDSESEPQVLNGLFGALNSLAAAPS